MITTSKKLSVLDFSCINFRFGWKVFQRCKKLSSSFFPSVQINKALNLKAYNKIRATDIISHSSPKRRSICNASRWSNLSSVTGCFTTCISTHFPAIESDNAILFRFRSGLLRGCHRLLAQLQIVPLFRSSFPEKHVRAWSVSM